MINVAPIPKDTNAINADTVLKSKTKSVLTGTWPYPFAKMFDTFESTRLKEIIIDENIFFIMYILKS